MMNILRMTVTRLMPLIVGAVVAFPAMADTPVNKDAIRVGSYNIRTGGTADRDTPNAWENRKAALVALVKRLELDAFGLQEVRPDQLAYLSENLPEFAFVGEHRGADRRSDEASPVAYRKCRFEALKSGTFWLSETPDTPGLKGWGAACPRVCSYLVLREKSGGRVFCFANTHTDHRSELAREKGMTLVLDRMRSFGGGAPIVFTGDHNCRETEAPAIAVSKRLRNALYATETPPVGSWRTFNGWRGREVEVLATDALKLPVEQRNTRLPKKAKAQPGTVDTTYCGTCGGSRIDYIYVSPGVRVLDYATVNETRPGTRLYPSDHFPIVATVVLPPAAPTVVRPFTYRVEMAHGDGVYEAGDRVPLVVTAVGTNGEKVASGTVRYQLDNFGARQFSAGTVDLAKANPFTVVATRQTPGIVRLKLMANGSKDFVWGVAFSPEKIRTGSARPADFDAFWSAAKATYDREVPVDVKLERLDRFSDAKQTAYRLSLTTPHGKTIDGVLTEPADLSQGPFPVRLSVPGAGPSTGCPSAANGKIRLTMNVHFYPLVVGEHKHSKGNAKLLALEKAETAECREKFRVNRYSYAGVAVSREEYHYYDCILAISRAFDWLWARPEVKKDDFRYSGTSQGGGFGLIMTGFNTHVTRTVTYVPAMTDTLGYLDDGRQSGWPLLVEGHPEDLKAAVAKNAPYFDAAHFAARIKTPIRVAVGLSDTVCAPGAVWAGYNAIPSADKAILPTPGMSHKVDSKVYKTLGAWLEK